MSEERRAAAPEPFLARPMRWITALLLQHPIATIAVAVFLAISSLAITGVKLGYKTSRTDLLDPSSDYNARWLNYLAEFGTDEDAVIVVQGASRDQVVAVLREISQRLGRDPQLFHSVLTQIDLTRLRSKGLYYLSAHDLHVADRMLDESRPVLEGEWVRLKTSHVVAGLLSRWEFQQQSASAPTPSSPLFELQHYVQSYLAYLHGNPSWASPWPAVHSLSQPGGTDVQHLLAADGRLGFILLHLAPGKSNYVRGSEAVSVLREVVAQIRATHASGGVSIGLTGIPILENDEMQASQSSMLWSGLVSLVAVGLIFVAGFGGLRHALMANVVLLIGMAWAFAYVTLSIGHLNILSVSFAVTLIGVGIDYGVYYVARYMKARTSAANCDEALLTTTSSVGPAIAAGAVTTAIVFFAAGFTSFAGVAELGIIAGGGILLCAVAQLFVLPAVIKVVDHSRLGQCMPCPLPVHTWLTPLMSAPRLVLFVTLAGTVYCATGLQHLWYDHNLLNLQASGQESVDLEHKLLADCGQSMWHAVSIARTPEELLRRKAQFEKLPSVERTEEIISLVPLDVGSKIATIEAIARKLPATVGPPPQIPVAPAEELNGVLQHAIGSLSASPEARDCTEALAQLKALVQRAHGAEYVRLSSEFQQRSAADLLACVETLRSVSNAQPPGFEDLPESLVSRFHGKSGQHLLKVYGRGNIWDMDALTRFVRDVRSVDPAATGNPLQAYEASHEMKHSYERAAFYAMGIIFVVLLFDLRSIRFTLLACLPLGLGVVQAFGLMGLLDIPLNPANMIALPLILGISVDEGVHVVHDFREQTGRYRISPATAIAVLVDSLTTIAGFGSLMIASHQGLQSLGRVVTIGIMCCTFTSLVMLPAMMTWMTRNRGDGELPGIGEESADDGEAPIPFHELAEEDLIRPRPVYDSARAA